MAEVSVFELANLRSDSADYEVLRDKIIDLFNPCDGDADQLSILLDSLGRAAHLIAALPCACTPAAARCEDDPCARCLVLGRAGDAREER